MQIKLNKIRGVAQLASAPALGAGCRGFESLHSDQRQVATQIIGVYSGNSLPYHTTAKSGF